MQRVWCLLQNTRKSGPSGSFRFSLFVQPIYVGVFLILGLAGVDSQRARGGEPQGKDTDNGLLTIDRIFKSDSFSGKSYGTVHWLKGNRAYTKTAPSKARPGFQDIIGVDIRSGKTKVLVSADQLVPENETKPLRIESYTWSPNEGYVLIYTNSKRVWRQNTRGDYWVYDLSARELRKIGGVETPPSELQFAKFSPDSTKVAFVCNRNIYVQFLASGNLLQLTRSNSPNVINGTFDWVYEEELGLRDGLRWSPDSQSLAFWQLDTTGVGEYLLVDNTSGRYQKVKRFNYPKVGTKNSSCRVGVITFEARGEGEATCTPGEKVKFKLNLGPSFSTMKTPDVAGLVWLNIPGDSREHYIARMDWHPSSKYVILQQLNRLQNTNKVFSIPLFHKGKVEVLLTEKDSTWVDVHDHLHWFNGGKQFTWLSERDGWNHLYVYSEKKPALITPEQSDVIDAVRVDQRGKWIYYYASPRNPTQQYLYRARLDGSGQEKLTPNGHAGWNTYQISPTGDWAIHTHSSFQSPPVVNLVSLPDHKVIRVLEDNKKAHDQIKRLKRLPVKFFRVDIGEGVLLDGWCLKPHDFDPSKRYPVLFYVYGEPAGQTVLDRWTRDRYLWHLMLAQHGYLVMSLDNRGTPAPRGRAWRKIVYRKVGILAPREQAAAVKAIQKKWSWVDPKRVGVWGWSGGGSMSLHAIFRYPKVYHLAMSIAPVSIERYYDTIYQERYMGLPSDNAKGYQEGSPINYAKKLEGNLLIIHGTADDNVHYANTEAVVNELIAANKQFTMMAYPNRSHSIFEGRNTRRHLFTLLTTYLKRNLPAGPAKSSK
ncbi:MAG: S9 family peptidase [Gemmataceae bacterium]